MIGSSFLICGYYGMKNYGDDLFSLIACRGVKKYWGAGRATILAPGLDSVKYDYVLSDICSGIYSGFGLVGKGIRALSSIYGLKSHENVLFAGGSIFSSRESGVLKLIVGEAIKNRKNLSAIGVSVGPFDSVQSEKKVNSLLERFSYISTRDSLSYRYLKENGFEGILCNGADLAGAAILVDKNVAISESRFFDKKHDKSLIGYSACNFQDGKCDPYWLNSVYVDSMISSFDPSKVSIEVINLNSHKLIGDVAMNKEAAFRFKDAGFDVKYSDHEMLGVLQTWDKIAGCDFFITGRLHGALTAYMNNVPFALVEYHEKCSSFLVEVGQSVQMRNNNIYDGVSDYIEMASSARELPRVDPASYQLRALDSFKCSPCAKNVING